MKIKNVIYVLLVVTLLWSCGKDDGPSTPAVTPTSPKFEMEGYGFEAKEDIDDTAVIGTVKATDTDGDELTYNISENDDNLFKIDKESGEITLADGKNLDFETTDGHTITVTVTDGTNTVKIKVTIAVTNVIESLFEDPASFITTWTTPSDNFELQIGITDKLEYDFTIDWGDGTEVENVDISDSSIFFTHIYETVGTYTVAIQGDFPAIRMYDANKDSQEALTSIDQWGSIAWKDMEYAFAHCGKMEYHATDAPDLTYVTNMSGMFANADSFNGDLNDWDVSGVEDISGMFYIAKSFNGNISGWNTENVTNMGYLFSGANSFNGNISDWKTENVTDMSYMFQKATAFNGNISGWKTEKVTNMSHIFEEATAFNGDISGWKTEKVTNMRNMFNEATSFNGDISGWKTENVTDMSYMFNKATSFNQSLGGWNIHSVTKMTGMLDGSGMSSQSYDETLAGWAGKGSTPDDITFGASGINYCNGGAAKTALLNKGWTITDAGQGQNCP